MASKRYSSFCNAALLPTRDRNYWASAITFAHAGVIEVDDMTSNNLTNSQETKSFYESRYTEGYMEDWPGWKKARVLDIVAGLKLPEHGEALDFGCGNGVFTEVLARALPGWSVCGTDLSSVAVDNARVRVPGATFFEAGSHEASGRKFDLVFTHHVLEHVFNLEEAIDSVNSYVKAGGVVLHILPCGNPGSFEYQVCVLRNDGINQDRGNRFFFEDEGHLRRLTTNDLQELYGRRGFALADEFYSGQRDSAINWITLAGVQFVRKLTDESAARDEVASGMLRQLGRRLLWVAWLRNFQGLWIARVKRGKLGVKALVRLLATLPLFLPGYFLDRRLVSRDESEWRLRRKDRCGSEMYLLFVREGDTK